MIGLEDTSLIDVERELENLRNASTTVSDLTHTDANEGSPTGESEDVGIHDERSTGAVLLDAYAVLQEYLESTGIVIAIPRETLYSNFMTLRVILWLRRVFDREFLLGILRSNSEVRELLESSIIASEDEEVDDVEDETDSGEAYSDLISTLIGTLYDNYPLNSDLKQLMAHADEIVNTPDFLAYVAHLLEVIVGEATAPVINDSNMEEFTEYLSGFSSNLDRLGEFMDSYSKEFKRRDWNMVLGLLRNYHHEKYNGPQAVAFMFTYNNDVNKFYHPRALFPAEEEHRQHSKHHIEYWLNSPDKEIPEHVFVMLVFAIMDDVQFDQRLAAETFSGIASKYTFHDGYIDVAWTILNYEYTNHMGDAS